MRSRCERIARISRLQGAGGSAAGFEGVSVTFTHEVADGMHGAIVKATRAAREPRTLPLVAAKAGCC